MHSTNNGPAAATMRALRLRAYDGPASLELAEIAVPRPGRGEVLVRIAAAPVNPSDLLFLRGIYGVKKPLPAVPGFEGSGTVVAAGWKSGHGNYVEIDHGHGIRTTYSHASRVVVRGGQEVQRGDTVALVGSTGFSVAPHVHYEVHESGRPIDPLRYIFPDAIAD